MLRNNFNNASGLCARQWGTSYGLNRSFYSRSELRNYAAGEGFDNNKAGIPNGHTNPSSWILPQSTGGIAAYQDLNIVVETSLAPGTAAEISGNVEVTITASGTIKGIALLEGSITPFTELSPQNLANAVWNADSTLYTVNNTMGKNANEVKSNTILIPASV
jgi:hypothetical protein